VSETVVNIILVLTAWAVGGLVTYGFIKAKMLEFERRLEDLEENMTPRVEYESRHSDLLRQLDRIENKVDRLSRRP